MLSVSRVGRETEPVMHTAVHSSQLELRMAMGVDLDPVNAVIERAVMTWKLPERVKRLAMPSYRYTGYDLKCLHIVVAVDSAIGIVGVASVKVDGRDSWKLLVQHGTLSCRRSVLRLLGATQSTGAEQGAGCVPRVHASEEGAQERKPAQAHARTAEGCRFHARDDAFADAHVDVDPQPRCCR